MAKGFVDYLRAALGWWNSPPVAPTFEDAVVRVALFDISSVARFDEYMSVSHSECGSVSQCSGSERVFQFGDDVTSRN